MRACCTTSTSTSPSIDKYRNSADDMEKELTGGKEETTGFELGPVPSEHDAAAQALIALAEDEGQWTTSFALL